MYPMLFSIGSFKIYTYGVGLALAILVGMFLVWRRARRMGFNELQIIDMVFFAVFSSLVLGRVLYVLSHYSQFKGDFLKMVVVSYFPGLDSIGAISGVLLAVLLFGLYCRWNLRTLFDSVAIALSLAMSIVGIGAYLSASYIGTPTSLPWGAVLPGFPELRHPIALYYALLFVVAYWVLLLFDKPKYKDGTITALFFLFLGVALVLVSFVGVQSLRISGVSVQLIMGILSMFFGIYLYYTTYRQSLRRK